MQKKDSTTNQHKTEAAATTSTATPVAQQSLNPPPFQLKATGTIQEKKETEAESQTSMPRNYLVASGIGDTPSDGTTSNPNAGSDTSITQKKQDITAFQAPVQQKAATSTFSSYPAPIQQKAATASIPPFQAPVQKKSGSGNMPEDVRGKMENVFQADFSNVNVHQNSQSATDVGALAYAQGNDVHFAPGQFKPNTQSGQELIGHELTHVVQQREGRVQPTAQAKGMPVNDNPGLEQEADVMGRKAAQFKSNAAAAPQSNARNTSLLSHTNTIQKQAKRIGGGRGKEENSPEISNDFNTDPGWNEVGETGIVYQETGANLRATPIPGQGLIRNLAQNEKVSILKHNPSTKWYAVITSQSEIGYIADHLIWKNLPDYNTRVLQVEGGRTALGIAFEHYGTHFNSWGQDARFVVNALVYANNSTPQNGTGNKGIFNNSDDWENAELTANAYIWLPSVEFIRSLKETVGSGSITNDLWEGAKDIAKGAALTGAFIAGILHGAFDGLVTMVTDAIGGIWDIIKGIFTGTIIDDIKNMIDAILEMTWEDFMEMLLGWTEPWIEKTKSDNVFVKGHAYGYITGRILFEIISMFIGGGAAVKIIGKFGKLGRTIAGVINKVDGAIKNITGPAKEKLGELGGDIKAALQRAGARAAQALRLPNPIDGYRWTKTVDGDLVIVNDVGNQKYFDAREQSFNGMELLSTRVNEVYAEYNRLTRGRGTLTKADIETRLMEGKVFNPETRRFNSPNTPNIDKVAHRTETSFEFGDASSTKKARGATQEVRVSHADLDDTHRDHLKALEEERTAARNRRDSASTDAERRAAQQEMVNASEEIGEAATAAAVQAKVPGATKLDTDIPGAGKQGQFDQVYEKDGEILIFEAKGGEGTLGSRVTQQGQGPRVQQGTKDYLEDIIANMERKAAESGNFELYQTAEKLKEALRNNKISYFQVNQKFDTNGNLIPDVEISKFEL